MLPTPAWKQTFPTQRGDPECCEDREADEAPPTNPPGERLAAKKDDKRGRIGRGRLLSHHSSLALAGTYQSGSQHVSRGTQRLM